jgi:tRNA(His) 5'-end guanylyltransferase
VRKWATWRNEVDEESFWRQIATEAAQWGADQELEECCEWLVNKLTFREDGIRFADELRASRRPQPPSMKEQALRELSDAYNSDKIDDTTYNTIRRALKAQ